MTALSSCSGMSSSTLPAAALVGQAVRVCTGTPPAWKDGAVVVAGEGVWHAVLEDGAVLALAWGPLCAALTAAASHAAAGRQSKPAAPAPHAAPLPQPAAPRPAPAPAAAVATAPKRKYKARGRGPGGVLWRGRVVTCLVAAREPAAPPTPSRRSPPRPHAPRQPGRPRRRSAALWRALGGRMVTPGSHARPLRLPATPLRRPTLAAPPR